MKSILERYNKCPDVSQSSLIEYDIDNQYHEVAKLKHQVEQLSLWQKHMMGEQLSDLNLKELQQYERQLELALSRIKEKKEQALYDRIEEFENNNKQEQNLLEENRSLRRQLEEARKNSLTTDQRPTTFLEFHPLQTRESPASRALARPLVAHNSSNEESEISQASLHLGLFDSHAQSKASQRSSSSDDVPNPKTNGEKNKRF